MSDLTPDEYAGAANSPPEPFLRLHRVVQAVIRVAASALNAREMLHDASAALVDGSLFDQIWIYLQDSKGRYHHAASAGVSSAFEQLTAEVAAGHPPACLRTAMESDGVTRYAPSDTVCRECPVRIGHDEGVVWAVPMRFGGQALGAIFTVQREDTLNCAEAPALLLDAGVAIAAGLHRLEQQVARKEAERRFQALVDNLMGVVYQCRNDERWTMEYLSAGILALSGYRPEQLLGNAELSYEDIIHPDDRAAARDAVLEAVAEARPYILHYRILRADGAVRHVVERGHAAPNGHPLELRLEGLITDVTDQVERESQMRASESRFRHIFEHSALAKCITLPDGSFGEGNDRLCELLGYTREELGRIIFANITHPDDREMSLELSRQLIEGERDAVRVEKRYIHKDGSVIWVDITSSLLRDESGAPLYFVTAMSDINERKQMEKNLLATTRDLQNFLDVALELFCVTDHAGRVLRLNRQWEQVLGIPLEEIEGAQLLDFVHPDDREATIDAMSVAEEGRPVLDFVNRFRRADGTYLYLEWRAHPHGDINYAAARDVTARREHEDDLRRSEERFRLLIEGAPEPIFVQVEGKFEYLNRSACALFGVEEPEALAGQPVVERFHPDFRDIVQKRIKRLIEDSAPVPVLEERILRVDGYEVPVEVSAVPYAHDGKRGALVFLHDLTTRKRVEEKHRELEGQLQQAQKMESVGRLAGGVAHDFNNLLAPILGHAELIAEDISPDHPAKESLAEIIAAAERARDVAGQLLSFSRTKPIEMKPVDLNAVVAGFQKMLGNLLGEDITVILNLTDEPMPIQGDASLLEQVLLNLAINARDAMPDGGRFRIETAAVEIGEEYIAERPLVSPGDYTMLAVSDDGHGMDEATRNRIFDPFFTTKEHDKGTGLGLSNVYGIVKQHNGQVWVYSEVGHGTTFKVYIPISDRQPAMPHDSATPKPEVKRELVRRARVLVLEDQDPVRLLVVRMLERMGHEVIEAATLAEAREAAANNEKFDLMISDVILPDGKGPDAYAELSPLHPGMGIIYMSGYTEHVIVDDSTMASRFLQKPFTAKKLRDTVEMALDATPPESP